MTMPAKKNTAFIFYMGLVSQANTKTMQSNPTLAAGDFKVSTDGGALTNLTTLPTVTPASGKMIKVSLSASEMNGDNVTVVCSDAAGAEWCDAVVNISTNARSIDDLAYPATSGRSMVVDANGLVDANTVKVGPTGSGTAQTAGDIIGDTNDIQTRLPAALVSGRIDASVGAMAANTLTASALASDAAAEMATAVRTELTTELGRVDVAISTRLAAASYTAPDNAGIAAIQAKTDNLPPDPADASDIAAAFSSLSDQVSEVSVVSTGSAPNKLMEAFVLTTGSEVSGAYTDTFGVEQTYHQLADSAGTLDAYYETTLSPGRAPTAVGIIGHVNGANDDIRVMGWHWVNAAWVQIGLINGKASSQDNLITFPLFRSMVGAGTDSGKIRIRLFNTGLTSANVYIDQIAVGYVLDETELIFDGGVDSATSTTVVLGAEASSIDDFYYPGRVLITASDGSRQSNRIDGYVGATRTLQLATPWTVTPDNTYTVQVYPWVSVRISEIDPNVVDAAAIAAGALDGKGDWATSSDIPTSDVASIKAKTDSLTFTVAGQVDANITHVIGTQIQENGANDTNWGGPP